MNESTKSNGIQENWKINNYQLLNLVILCYTGTSIALAPGALAGVANQDAWIGAIIGTIGGLLIALLYNSFGNNRNDRTLVKYIEWTLGKYVGKLVGIIFVFFLLLTCAMQLWVVGDLLITHIMPETPDYILLILFVIVIIIGTRHGIEVIARSSELVFPLIITAMVVLVFSLFPQMKIEYIHPILERGFKPVFSAGLISMSTSSLTLIGILMIFPSKVANINEGKKAFLIGTLIGGIILVAITISSILVLGADIASRSSYPSYVLARKIQIGEFLQRVEVIFAVVWFTTVFYKIIIFFYGSVLGLSQILELKDYRVLTFPMGMILVVLSLIIYPSSIYAQYWDATTWIPLILTFALFLPTILLIIGKVKSYKK